MPDSSSTTRTEGCWLMRHPPPTMLAGRKMVNVVPAPGRGVDEHEAPVRLDGALHDGEAEPAAAGPAR